MRTLIRSSNCLAAAAMLLIAQDALAVPIQPGPPDFSWGFGDGSGNIATAMTGGQDGTIMGTEGVAFDWSTETLHGEGFALEHNPGFASPVIFGPNVIPAGPGATAWQSFSFAGWIKRQPPGPASTRSCSIGMTRVAASGRGVMLPFKRLKTSAATTVLGDFNVWNVHATYSRQVANFSDVSMTGGNWHHFAFVSVNHGATMTVYIDGVGTTKAATHEQQFTSMDDFWGFGNSSMTSTEDQFDGIWAKLQIYSGPLSAENVEWLIESAGGVPEPSGLAVLGLGSLLILRRRYRTG